ncbi:protein of unknown function [Taphrina deformans PYCC 5710]|uniref:Mediator of RNA polymerase II transcription subunit 8 n=1 Tax=Taphrina deformans (strain PYCC 5710 / ATCC 11124 / CBS 356.35 / IMI 108563 / JCM 9778 / NBRC 8474) TaxID=1097556 RepID=R4XDQ1_TAPDE|nr:protein of unknown function [Taphrina deformans PYCC 5710]|eukprot:CCG83960.1 protein of unknown function [Taphrina deformans PYCC 5710]
MNYEASLPAPQSLEQARVKLQQLTTSLQALQYRIQSGTPLPPWSQIQSGLSVILTQLASLTETLARSEDEIRAIVVFPNATFPVTTHEGLLTTLMRTKPLPESEDWIQQVKVEGEGLVAVPDFKWSMNENEDEEDIPGDEYNITEWLNIQKSKRQWTGFYTKQEMDDAFEIDRDDLDDIRKSRQEESDQSMLAMKAMMRFARSGR